MKSVFEDAGYKVLKTDLGGRHGTVGVIHLEVSTREEIDELTIESDKIVNLFADLERWDSFDIYISIGNTLKRKVILSILNDVKIFSSGLKIKNIVGNYNSNGGY